MKNEVKSLAIRQAAVLGMAFSAIEVFPKECMGGLLAKPSPTPLVVAAVPYQLAKRSKDAVETFSSFKLSEMKLGRLYKLGDYHSHPYTGSKNAPRLAPSEYDFEHSKEGEVDFIVQVVKVGYGHSRALCATTFSLRMASGHFRISMRAYHRGKSFYEEVPLRLCDM